MSEWDVVRHQVAIAGQVTDLQTGKALAQALVHVEGRADQVRTAADGHFHFLDLPDGQYTLTVSLPGSGTRYGQPAVPVMVTVARDADGNIHMGLAEIAVPPTTVKGQVTEHMAGDAVVMAEVRVKGSGERAFSDGQGNYLLTGLEAGERTLVVSARGYQPADRKVLLSQAGAEQTLNFELLPATMGPA